MKSIQKGMIPITKNIIVINEQGQEYEKTYPKRAKSLVKKGRAYFLEDNKICLICPPSIIHLEDEMTEETINMDAKTKEATQFMESFQKTLEKEPNVPNENITVRELFERIGDLQKVLTSNVSYFNELKHCINALQTENEEIKEEHLSDICNVFKRREDNISRIIGLYESLLQKITK